MARRILLSCLLFRNSAESRRVGNNLKASKQLSLDARPTSTLELRLTKRQLLRRSRQPTEALEPYVNTETGQASTLSQTVEAKILELNLEPTTSAYEAQLRDFIDHQATRYIGTAGNQAAAGYIEDKLRALGLNVTTQPFEVFDKRHFFPQ